MRNWIRSFSWYHVYAPVFSNPLLSYLPCPTRILLGVRSLFVMRSDVPKRGLYLVSYIDRKTVEYVGDESMSWRGRVCWTLSKGILLHFPIVIAAKYKLDRILFPNKLVCDLIHGYEKALPNTQNIVAWNPIVRNGQSIKTSSCVIQAFKGSQSS